MTLLTEAEDAGDVPFRRSIFQLSNAADLSPARIRPLLDELAELGAIECEPSDDWLTVEIAVL